VEIDHTVYALDATTIDLCLSMFPWAGFRSIKAAVKLHTLLDLRGAIPSFIHISDGKLHDVNVFDLLLPEPGAFYIMDRSYLDALVCARSGGQLLRHPRQEQHERAAPVLRRRRSQHWADLRSDHRAEQLLR
jgi:hypothetical protein